MTTQEEIQRVLELDAAATPGPWESYEAAIYTRDERDCYRIMRGDRSQGDEVAVVREWSHGAYLDAELITAYRTLAPLLARKLERAMDELRRVTTFAEYRVARDAEDAIDEIEAME